MALEKLKLEDIKLKNSIFITKKEKQKILDKINKLINTCNKDYDSIKEKLDHYNAVKKRYVDDEQFNKKFKNVYKYFNIYRKIWDKEIIKEIDLKDSIKECEKYNKFKYKTWESFVSNLEKISINGVVPANAFSSFSACSVEAVADTCKMCKSGKKTYNDIMDRLQSVNILDKSINDVNMCFDIVYQKLLDAIPFIQKAGKIIIEEKEKIKEREKKSNNYLNLKIKKIYEIYKLYKNNIEDRNKEAETKNSIKKKIEDWEKRNKRLAEKLWRITPSANRKFEKLPKQLKEPLEKIQKEAKISANDFFHQFLYIRDIEQYKLEDVVPFNYKYIIKNAKKLDGKYTKEEIEDEIKKVVKS